MSVAYHDRPEAVKANLTFDRRIPSSQMEVFSRMLDDNTDDMLEIKVYEKDHYGLIVYVKENVNLTNIAEPIEKLFKSYFNQWAYTVDARNTILNDIRKEIKYNVYPK